MMVERNTNSLIMEKHKYGGMPLAETVWRLLHALHGRTSQDEHNGVTEASC